MVDARFFMHPSVFFLKQSVNPTDVSSVSQESTVTRLPTVAILGPATEPTPEAASMIGRTFGGYRIVSAVRRGGMGEILLAEVADGPNRGAQVVVKRPLCDDDERRRWLFGSEVQIALRLDHPNIVRVLDAPIVEDRPCLIMEFVQGWCLGDVIRRCGELSEAIPPEIAAAITIEVLGALEYAHALELEDGTPMNLIHRDITPENVMLSRDGAVKVTDFGVAKSNVSLVATRLGELRGTIRYMSPEHLQGDEQDGRSDLFSLGLVLFEMLTGTSPFERGSPTATLRATVTGNRRPIVELLPPDAAPLASVIERALAVDPNDRFESAAAMRHALLALGTAATAADLSGYLRTCFGGAPAVPPSNQTEIDFDVDDDPDPWAETGDLEGHALAEPMTADVVATGDIRPPATPLLARTTFLTGLVVGAVVVQAIIFILSMALR